MTSHDSTRRMSRESSSSDEPTAGDHIDCEIFVRIPEGWFQMGSEDGPEDTRPVHPVWVDAFEMAIHPVTCGQYARFLRATGHERPRDWSLFAVAGDLPVVGVSWLDCEAYCRWRNETDASVTSTVDQRPPLRLPTEAEWERAARGGIEGRRYPWGDEIPAWIPEEGRGPLAGPWPVTLGEPNGFGVFGIAANIHEWCTDWYASDFYASSPDRNPSGPEHGVRRASRGGSWRHAV